MAQLHYKFNAIIHRTYVSPYETCINSDPKRRHSLRSDIAWVVARADGETGPVGPDCARTIASDLGVRLRDFPDFIKEQDETFESRCDHETCAAHGTVRTREYNENAADRLSRAQAYLRDYKGLTDELADIGLRRYLGKYMPGAIKIALRGTQLPEEVARSFMRTAESTTEFNMAQLKNMHKLLKRLITIQADCLRHVALPELRNPDWSEIAAKPNYAKTPEEWIAAGKARLPEYIRRFINRANDRDPHLTKGEMQFCKLMAARDLGYGWDYFKPEEFGGLTKQAPTHNPDLFKK